MDEGTKEAVQAPPGRESNGRYGWTWIYWIFAFMFLAYPLSIGPVAKLYFMNAVPKKPVELFYAPLEGVARRWQPLNQFFQWYLEDVWHARPASAPLVTPPPSA